MSCPPINRAAARRLARGWAAGDGPGDGEARSDGTPAWRWVPGIAAALVSIIFLNLGYFPKHAGAKDGLLGTGVDLTDQEGLSNMRAERSWIAVTTPVLALGCAAVGDVVAAQWAESDGGNGHWYAVIDRNSRSWLEMQEFAVGLGGHLATLNSVQESRWLVGQMAGRRCALGGIQEPGSDEPAGGWRWITGEPMNWTNWTPGEPQDGDLWGAPHENVMGCWESGGWVDLANHLNFLQHAAIEWSADCNSDGIVDYGQILAGDLADANSNCIPDLCELPTCIDADLNPNGIVDGADLGAMLAFWGPVSPAFPRADINRDGNVNLSLIHI